MKVICPNCGAKIAADDVNVQQDTAYCRECEEGFPLSKIVGSGESPERVVKPDKTKVIFDRRERFHLAAILPRGGPRGAGCFMLVFTLFWNAISWTGAYLTWMEPGDSDFWFGRIFIIPFLIIGLATLVIALWLLFGRTSIAMDPDTLLIQWRLLGSRFTRRYETADITRVDLAEAYRQNDVPVYGVGIFLKSRSTPLTFGSSLSEDEKKWLVWELHDFWKEATKREHWP